MKISINQFINRVFAIAIVAAAVGCSNPNVVETPSGLEVEFLRKANGDKFEVGDELEVNLVYVTEDGRKLFDTDERGGSVKIRMTDQDKGLFHEMIQTLTVGDSATCEIVVENLYEETFGRPVPDTIKRGTMLKFNIGIKSALNLNEIIEAQKKVDAVIIDDYLERNNIQAQKDKTGLRYVVTKEGTGEKPNIGDSLVVHYSGRILETGKQFDSSLEKGKPFEFVVGRGVIEGWSRGFTLLNEGSKATLYIPSGMGYGPMGYPRLIPRNAVLIFDVEFIEIKK
ncbi:MAG: FKBP-type peptidyl-prolyl cis-trans isomerase [bacterium]|nr:FKBP-type peptidyl-prolyl cis-trans isomerase [bacterium]